MSKLISILVVLIVGTFSIAPQAYAQQGEVGITQLRAMQTRKFLNIDLTKLTNAIETVVQNYGLQTACTKLATDTFAWCDAVGPGGYIDFAMRADPKEKIVFLRVSYIKGLHKKTPSDETDFYRKFFKNMGDVLFVDSQQLDMQEIN